MAESVQNLTNQENNQYQLRRLMASVQASFGRLNLLIGVCDDTKYRGELIRAYENQLKAKGVKCFRLLVVPRQLRLWDNLAELVANEPDFHSEAAKTFVTVLGTDEFLSSRLSDPISTQDQFFFWLQWNREALRRFKSPLILWVTSRTASELAKLAPDFWSWRGGIFEFFQPDIQNILDGQGMQVSNPSASVIHAGSNATFNFYRDVENLENGPKAGGGAPGKRQRLGAERIRLNQNWQMTHEKLAALESAYAIEAAATRKFQLEKQIEAAKAELQAVETRLHEIEALLASPLLESAGGQSSKKGTLHLPYDRNPFFTGRDGVILALHQQLSQHGATALSQAISGLGGIGKTQIALEYAYRYCQDEPVYDWVFWVKADTDLNLASDFAQIAQQVGVGSPGQTVDELVQAAQQWLENSANTRWLLIFDNADNPVLLRRFRVRNPEGRVLITSRAQVFDRLGIVQPLKLPPLSVTESVAFLFGRTIRDQATAAAGELAAAQALAEALGGLPLALEQAGAYIREQQITFVDYWAGYQERQLAFLEEYGPVIGDYPASVRTTWALNLRAIATENPAAIELLQLSSFLAPDNIPYFLVIQSAKYWGGKIQFILADSLDSQVALAKLLTPLSSYSLVLRDHFSKTYSMHPMVQSIIRDQITSLNQKDLVEKIVEGLNAAFPVPEFQNWSDCNLLLPHVQNLIYYLDLYTCESLSLARLLNQTGYYLYTQGYYSEAKALYLRSIAIWERLVGKDSLLVSNGLNNLALLYRTQGRYSEAEPLYLRSQIIREKQLGADHPDVASSLNNLAFLYTAQGRYNEAEPLYHRSLEIWERQLGAEHPSVATSLNNLAELYASQGRYSEAEPLFLRSLQIWEQQLGADHPDVASSLNNLAELYYSQGRYRDAEPLFLRSLQIREQQLGADHPDVAQSLNNLAALYRTQGRYRDAEPLYLKSQQIWEQQLGAEHPDVANSLNNLAALYYSQGRYRDAEPLLLRSQRIREQQLGADHPDVANSLNNLASLYASQGRYRDAESLLLRSLAIKEQQLGADHPDVANSLNNLANLYASQGRYSEAEPLLLRSQQIREQQLGADHPDVATSLNNLAALYRTQGRYRDAEPLYLKSQQIREQQLGADHPDVAQSLWNLAVLYHNIGRYSEAKPLIQRAVEIMKDKLGDQHPHTISAQKLLEVIHEK